MPLEDTLLLIDYQSKLAQSLKHQAKIQQALAAVPAGNSQVILVDVGKGETNKHILSICVLEAVACIAQAKWQLQEHKKSKGHDDSRLLDVSQVDQHLPLAHINLGKGGTSIGLL